MNFRYDVNLFLVELARTSEILGEFNARIKLCKFASVLASLFRVKEIRSSSVLDDINVTLKDILSENIRETSGVLKRKFEYVKIHEAVLRGENDLLAENFSLKFVRNVHWLANCGFVNLSKQKNIDRFLNHESKKELARLLRIANEPCVDEPALIRWAIAHLQFALIRPFESGNDRTNRILTGLYAKKSKLTTDMPLYVSDAILEQRGTYFSAIADSQKLHSEDCSAWIKFFLKLVSNQLLKNIALIEKTDNLYWRTSVIMRGVVSSPKYDLIMDSIFRHPYINSKVLSEELNVTVGQAKRYLENLEANGILVGGDYKRNKVYSFMEMLELLRMG